MITAPFYDALDLKKFSDFTEKKSSTTFMRTKKEKNARKIAIFDLLTSVLYSCITVININCSQLDYFTESRLSVHWVAYMVLKKEVLNLTYSQKQRRFYGSRK